MISLRRCGVMPGHGLTDGYGNETEDMSYGLGGGAWRFRTAGRRSGREKWWGWILGSRGVKAAEDEDRWTSRRWHISLNIGD
ncbi:unnamed protein product [Caenorhabditis auriculariae]|uniref:Uncharacterized protein n=1 Tax=Caenorhabditis auriculariae TaxID=2777116 RepID=A0A8S1H5L9_9PELO|nr:unnamed protein product [Caenorhabditis auriculariae]